MEWWQAVILGLVEGITEYLPISSTGHLILASAAMGLDDTPERARAVDAFNIVIQGGAILAVLGLYWPRVLRMLRGLVGLDREGLMLAVHVLIAFLPAAVLGVLFDDVIEAVLFGPVPVAASLALGGVFMILVDRARVRPMRAAGSGFGLEGLTPARAAAIGLLQCVAMIPGTSRSMMTIAGGVLVGLKPRDAAEFSFLLGLPTLGGACAYKLYKNLTAVDPSSGDRLPTLFEQLGVVNAAIGIGVAAASAALAVRWLVGFLNTHGLSPFGWYRFVVAAVVAAALMSGSLPSRGAASDERTPRDHEFPQAQD